MLRLDPKYMIFKRKIDTLDFIKILKFCSAKDSIKRMKNTTPKWKKIFANRVSDKELVSTIYKNSQSSTVGNK